MSAFYLLCEYNIAYSASTTLKFTETHIGMCHLYIQSVKGVVVYYMCPYFTTNTYFFLRRFLTYLKAYWLSSEDCVYVKLQQEVLLHCDTVQHLGTEM